MGIRRLSAALAAAAISSALTGCYADNCELRGACPVLDAGMIDDLSVACDPASEDARDGCGVFVSASLGSDEDGTGASDRPFRTLAKGLQASEKGHHTVYACAEVFDEALVVSGGYRVLGGFACDGDWTREAAGTKTEVRGEPGVPALRIAPFGGAARIVDVRFQAADAVDPGGSSIAALLPDGAAASFERCQFFAGRGGRGLDGQAMTAGPPVAASGPHGLTGANACTGEAPAGGAFVANECDDGIVSSGGLGGAGGPEAGFAGTEGTPLPAPNPQGFGASGLGEAPDAACVPGQGGAAGDDGAHGAGGHGLGTLHALGYAGRDGEDGAHGKPGQGGGGGGGARGGLLFCGNKPNGGAGGGSGGAGGCGGRGGRGGTFGGASIGIVVGDAVMVTRACEVATDDGGDGGSGGMYQLGGAGGFQGIGGHGVGGSKMACAGGAGGPGGRGGYGGGGSGGPSVGVAHRALLGPQDLTLVKQGHAGHGGWGGNPNLPDLAGAPGIEGLTAWMPDDP